MPGPIFLPPPIRRVKRCDRCGQSYPARRAQCPHCAGLSDREVEALREQVEAERAGSANLGRLFLYLAAVAGVFIVLMVVLS